MKNYQCILTQWLHYQREKSIDILLPLTQHFFTKDLQFVYHSFALFCYFIRQGVLNNEYSKDIELYN
jgi:hypothetical protein